MSEQTRIKDLVKEKYGDIARNAATEKPVRARAGCCSGSQQPQEGLVGGDYTTLEGYEPDADLGLGCGLPTHFARISRGDTVVDLGSGAGNDAFVARVIVGEEGHVIGVDMTEEMIDRARAIAKTRGYDNVEFRPGEIESLPVDDASADVVVSNCVLNLVPDKQKAFDEIYRVLKPGAHFCVSDIVVEGDLPDEVRRSAEMYVGCIAGAMDKSAYLAKIDRAGFTEVGVKKHHKVDLPDEVLEKHLTREQIAAFRKSGASVSSVTVVGVKPGV
jgi:arsenite methyltransferase